MKRERVVPSSPLAGVLVAAVLALVAACVSGSSGGGGTPDAEPGAGTASSTGGVSSMGGTGPMATGGVSSSGAAPSTTGGAGGSPPASTGGTVSVAGSGSCPDGTMACGTTCRDLMTDPANCGACGNSCSGLNETCVAGQCACPSNRMLCGTACVDTSSDPSNCGACGTTCTGVCSQGSCGGMCASHLTQCGQQCVDVTGSKDHCGSCDNACLPDETCFNSNCRCPTGQGSCGGVCINVATDVNNCGDCDNHCATGQMCVDSACECPGETEEVCGAECRDLASDPQNCGACGTTCPGGTQCLYGACIDPNSVSCSGGSASGNNCTRDASIITGKYWINNNQWGADGLSGQQCIQSTCQTGDLVGWNTDWSWNGGSGGVISFASLVFGWQWGWKVNNTGLPVQISSNSNVTCGWNFTVSQTGIINVAYDTFLHTTSSPGSNDDPTDEVMVWLYRANGAGPIGSRSTTVNIAGTDWDLYDGRGVHPEWNVMSYVRTTNATTAILNLSDFMRDLVQRGWLSGSKYLSTVQAGTEVSSGSGELQTSGFYCRIQ